MMRDECEAMDLPQPEYVVERNRIQLIFRLPEKKDTPEKFAFDISNMTDKGSKV